MKKLNRFISFVVLAAFLVNSTLTDLAFAQNSTDKLAIASRFDDLMGPQGQDMSRIRFMLAGHIAGAKDGDSINLPRLIENVSTYSDSSAAHKSRIEFEPMQVFAHEMRPLPSNLMYVMCRVRHKFLGLHTYYAVFPRTWEGEGFPIEVYTEKEWSKNKIYEFLADNYIHRRSDHKPSAAAAIERDVVHQGFDSVLQWAHDPSNAEHIRTIDSIGMDYQASMSDIMNRFREFGIIISGSDNPDIRPIEDREPSIVVISGPVKERLVRNMVSLKAIDGTPLDVIPAAHLSNNYLNTLLTPQEIRTLSKGGKNADRIKKDITARWVHEVGVSVGLPIIFFEGLRPVNLFDLLWKHDGNFEAVRRELDAHMVDAITAGFRGDNTYKIQDLDTNIETRDAASVSGLWNSLTGRSKDPKRADSLPKKVLSALGIRDVAGITVKPIYNIYKMVVTRSHRLSVIKSSSNDILLRDLDARNGHYFSPNVRYLFVRSSDHEATVYDLMAPDIAHMTIIKVEDLGDEYPFDKSSRFIRVYDSNFVEIIYDLHTGKALPTKMPAPVVDAPAPGGEGRAVETPAAASVGSSGVRAEPIDAAQPQQSSERADTLPKLEDMEEFADAAARAVANSAPSSSSPWKDFGSSGKSSPEEKDPASVSGEIFEIASGTAQSVISAFKDFFDASIGSSRQKIAAVILESHAEVTYAFARAVLDVMKSRDISRRPDNFGSVAMSAYETVLMASHSSKGMMTKGDPRFNNLKSLMEKVERALPHDSILRKSSGRPGEHGLSVRVEQGDSEAGYPEIALPAEVERDVDTLKTFDEVYGAGSTRYYDEIKETYDLIEMAIQLTSSEIEEERRDNAFVPTVRIGIIPNGERDTPGKTLVSQVRVNKDSGQKERLIGVYQSFIEGLLELSRLKHQGHYLTSQQDDVISALVEGAVYHEIGHSLIGHEVDALTLFTDPELAAEAALFLGVKRVDGWTGTDLARHVGEAVADSCIGGRGNKDYARNKAAYLFYKLIVSRDPKDYLTVSNHQINVDTNAIAGLIRGYYELNPHLKAVSSDVTADTAAVSEKVVSYFKLFYGAGSVWQNAHAKELGNKARDAESAGNPAGAQAGADSSALRSTIAGYVRSSYTRKSDSDRTQARRELVKLAGANGAMILEVIDEELAGVPRDSASARMLKTTRDAVSGAIRAVSVHQGDAEITSTQAAQKIAQHEGDSLIGLYNGWQIEVNVPRVGILFPHSVKNVMDNWVAPYLKKHGSNISKDTLKSWLQLGNNYNISVDETAGGLVFSMMGNVHALHEEVVCSGKISRGIKTPPQLELLRPIYKSDIKVAALDWDGTISRIREGWEGIMAPLVAALVSGIEITPDEWKGILECVKNDKPVDKKYLSRLSDESISWALEMINETKGEPTPTQFGRACEEARARGNGAGFSWVLDYYRAKGETIDEANPQKYFCKYYLEKLYELRDYRLALVDSGAVSPGEYLVKGGVEFIRMLVGGGVRVVIVTGSDQKGVQQEVDILGLGDLVEVTGYDVEKEIASKYDIIKNLKESSGYKGDQILVMGDGKVEIKAGMELGCKTIALRSRDNAGILFDTKILPLEPDGIMSSHFEPVGELAELLLPVQQDYHARKAALEKLAKERGFIPFLGTGAIPLYNESNGTNHSLESVMNDAELQSRLLIWAIEEFDLDGIPAMMDLTIETEAALLANIPEDKQKEILAPYDRETFSKFDDVAVPQMEPELIEKAGTEWWKNPKEFDVRTVGRMKVQAETIRRLKARFGNSKVISGYVVAPYTLAEHFMGSNMMSGHDAFTSMLSETEEFKAIMAYSEKLIAQYAKLLIESGADVIAMLDPTPTGNIGPASSKTQSIVPVNRLARFIRENGALAAFHPCKPMGSYTNSNMEFEYLKVFAEADVDILSLDAVYDSGKISDEFGPLTLDTVYDFIEEHSAAKPVIIGSVDTGSVLPKGTPEEVFAAVNKQIYSLAGKKRGYLIGSSCDIITTLTNMRAFAKAGSNKGKFTKAIHVPNGHPDLKVEQARQLLSDGIRYVSKDGAVKVFYPNDRLVPTVGVRPRFGYDGRVFTVGELAETGVLGSPQEKLLVVPNDDSMTHVSGDILTSIMDSASYLYNIGLATGGTTEALRKLMGLPEVLKKTYGRTVDAEKIMKICTLDNYYFEDYMKRRGLSKDEADFVLEVSSYENEQLYMMIENMMQGVNGWQFFAPPTSTDLNWLDAAEQFRQALKRHFVIETYLHYRGNFVDGLKHAHQLWQLHGIGTDSHDAFNEVFMHLVDTSILRSQLIRHKTGEVRHAYLPDGTDLAEFGLVDLPPSGRIPSNFLMPVMRDDHASWIHPGTQVQNAGHFTDDLHPFFLKLIGDKSAYDWDEIIASILALTPDELLNYSKNPKYHFRDMRHFVDELNKVISQYANVPYESTSQGTGAILNRGSMPLPDGSYPLQLFMACAAHKQLATLRAVLAQTPSDMQWSTAAAVLHMAKNAILVATQESLDMIYDRDYEAVKTRFIRVEPDAAGLNDAAEAGWRETPPGKRITESLRKHRGEKETPGPNAEDDVGGTDVLSDGGVITGRDWTREGPDMYRNRANPKVVARRNPLTGKFDHTGGSIDLETARFNTNRAREAIAVIAKSGSLQRMIQQNIGFRLPDYTAVCPDELQKSAAEDLDMLVDRGVLVRDEARTYRPSSAWGDNMARLRSLFEKTGSLRNDDDMIEGRSLLNGTQHLAAEVGLEMPTQPGERYRLLMPESFFANGELDSDKNKFGDRFELDGVKGETGGDIVRSIIRHARGNEGRSIAVIPNSIKLTDKNIGDLQSLGIGFIRVDAEAISELRFAAAAERAQFRMDTYAIMWLARYVRDATPESGAHELLRFYLKTHFAFASAKEMEDYIDALVKGESARLANAYLRYRPSMPKDAEADYHRVAVSLIFA